MKQQRVILALLALVAGLSEGRLGPVRSGRAQVPSVPNGVSAKCTSSHLEEDCAVTGLPVIKDIGFDAPEKGLDYKSMEACDMQARLAAPGDFIMCCIGTSQNTCVLKCFASA